MIESIIQGKPKIEASDARVPVGFDARRIRTGDSVPARPSNVDDVSILKEILGAVMKSTKRIPIIFPAHPRTQKQTIKFGMDSSSSESGLRVTEPMGYLDFIAFRRTAGIVLTDSGGVQEESTFFGLPYLSLRENTERPITVRKGTNRLVPLNQQTKLEASEGALEGNGRPARVPEMWHDGLAGRSMTVLGLYSPTDSSKSQEIC